MLSADMGTKIKVRDRHTIFLDPHNFPSLRPSRSLAWINLLVPQHHPLPSNPPDQPSPKLLHCICPAQVLRAPKFFYLPFERPWGMIFRLSLKTSFLVTLPVNPTPPNPPLCPLVPAAPIPWKACSYFLSINAISTSSLPGSLP